MININAIDLNDENNKCSFEYNENEDTIIFDLFEEIEKRLGYTEDEINNISRFVYTKIEDKCVEPLYNFNLREFMSVNNCQNDQLDIVYGYGGIGDTLSLDDSIRISFRPKEGLHIGHPHIHVSNDKGKTYVSINISNCEVEKSSLKVWEKNRRKDRNDIVKLIKDHKEDLEYCYNCYVHGYKPHDVSLVFRNSQYYLQNDH